MQPDIQPKIDPDLGLIAGEFFDMLLPKNKQYLWYYFKTDIERQFVTYYLLFNCHGRFSHHTGYVCSDRYCWKMQKRLRKIENAFAAAQKAGDIETIAAIKMGNFKCRKVE